MNGVTARPGPGMEDGQAPVFVQDYAGQAGICPYGVATAIYTEWNNTMKTKWQIGITDYITPPADIEQQAFPEAEFEMVKGYVPLPEMRWNSAWVVKKREIDFKKFIDEAFTEMLESGEIKRIVERYGMPFFPPVEQ